MVFSGIVESTGLVTSVTKKYDLYNLEIQTEVDFLDGLKPGASVCVDGVCLTVTSLKENKLKFDVIVETLRTTTFNQIELNDLVNLERSIKFGDEIGGHILSGHVSETIKVEEISKPENNYIISFKVSKEIMNYIFPKGYVAINGVSLTISDVVQSNNTFKVYLIPETLHRTNWSTKVVGDLINIEIDYQTRNTVDTITRITKEHIDA